MQGKCPAILAKNKMNTTDKISVGTVNAFSVYWIIVPAILLSIAIFSLSLVNRTREEAQKFSAAAGFRAGAMIFVIAVVFQINSITITDFTQTIHLSPSLWGVAFGVVCAFLFLLLLKHIIPLRSLGFIVMVLSASSMYLLFSYFLIRNVNEYLLSYSLGMPLGVYIYNIVWPKQLYDYFKKK